MRTFLCVVLLVILASVSVWAKTYSCRDTTGQLHFSYNLDALPVECLDQVKEVGPGPIDNLQYVPATPVKKSTGTTFEQNVKEVEQQLQRKQEQRAELRQRAEKIVERFEQARSERREAKRRWNYSSRDRIKKADAEIARVREKKTILLEELAESRLDKEDRDYIKSQLGNISTAE